MTGLLAIDSLVGLRYFSADEVLSPYIYVFVAAYLVALAFTPIMQTIAVYYGIIDQPDGLRKMHSVPVAYLGGVAVFLGWLTGLAASQFLPLHRIEPEMPRSLVIHFPIVVGACAIVLLGLWDDIFHISPKRKILGQAAAALCLLLAGVGRRSAWLFMAPMLSASSKYLHWPQAGSVGQLYLHPIVEWASVFFVVGIVVICCNAANLMDGLDGLCGGVTAVVSSGFLFLAVNLAMVSGSINTNEDALRVVLGLALLGGVLGFVPYNFNPASIFMGDAGSMFLGFCCATMMVLFAAGGHFKWFLASMVMFSLPLLDTALAFVRRYVNRRPLFSADRYHFHHQLVARGFSVKQTVLISYGLSVIFCLLGAAIVYTRTRYAICIYLVVFGSIIVAAFKMGMVHERVEPTARKLPSGTNGDTIAEVAEPAAVHN
jgi:UDP-GlcNAc:undecaprenyl-phosphate GlcNAc-1-phosphate transferase